jgi:hypothetical protein
MRLFLVVFATIALSLSISGIVNANCGGNCGGCKMEKAKEEKVALNKCPEKVQQTIKKEAEGGTIGEIAKVTKGETVTFEAEITVGEDKYELTVSSDGKLLKKELETEDEEEGEDDED